MPTAFLIDGDFFLRRYRAIFGNTPPDIVASDLHKMCLEHLERDKGKEALYRIFFYDCRPLTGEIEHPASGKIINFSETPTALWRNDFHASLVRLRKVALRLGYLNLRSGYWTLKPDALKSVISGEAQVSDLADEDFHFSVQQKGVDMRIGLDIAALAFKRLVDQVVLVAGDSDFVPAAKLARREGIDFILDPLWAPIRDDLHEHVDGLRTVFPRPQLQGD